MYTVDPHVLQQYLQTFPQEASTIDALEQYLQYLPKNRNCHDKLSGSAWIFNTSNGKILLNHHKKLNRWIQPGGHADKQDGENLQITAEREAREESGLAKLNLFAPNPIHIAIYLQNNDKNPYYLFDFCYIFSTDETEIKASPRESNQLQWVSNATILREKPYSHCKILAKKWQMICHEHLANT